MGDLSVTIRLNGQVVEDRVVPVHRLVRIGDGPAAVVSFPGADVAVLRIGESLSLRGRLLDEGDEMHIALGAVDVSVQHTIDSCVPHEWAGLFDFRFFSVTLVIMAMGTWIDASDAWFERQPFASSPTLLGQAVAMIEASDDGGADQRAAAVPGALERFEVPVALTQLAEGPIHEPDDALTGTGWYRWYRQVVPHDDDQVAEAYERFAWNEDDAAARRVLARAAYDSDDFETASWHYQWLVERSTTDIDLRIRLARAEKRSGRHASEAQLYREVLDIDGDNAAALGGLALALGRMNRFDEAAMLLDGLQVVAPHSPYTEVTVALIAAMKGRDSVCIDALERAFRGRAHLSRELRIEFRRDLALDPVFASLRKDQRLRSLVHRHLGAAGPLPVR